MTCWLGGATWISGKPGGGSESLLRESARALQAARSGAEVTRLGAHGQGGVESAAEQNPALSYRTVGKMCPCMKTEDEESGRRAGALLVRTWCWECGGTTHYSP